MISKVSNAKNVINKILSAIMSKPVQMAMDLSYFRNYRSLRDGVDVLQVRFDADFDGDHTPSLNLFIGLFNFKILELNLYNIFHEEDLDETVDEFIASLAEDEDINSEDDNLCPDKLEPQPDC